MSILLRRAGAADLPDIVTLMNSAFRGTGPAASWNTEALYISGDRTSEPLLRADVAEPGAVLLVAFFAEDGASYSLEPQGCVLLKPLSPETWYLGSLTSDPRLQKSGSGRALLTGAEQYAVEQGARTMQMTVVQVRDTLIAWYERRGYRLTGETRPFPYGDTRFGVPLRDDLAFVVLEKALM